MCLATLREELADQPDDFARIERIKVMPGHPTSTILAEAVRCGADLLMIGTHSKGRLEYAFLGGVAKKVMRKADIPVLLIPLAP